MTSGNFRTIDITSITIHRTSRQRKELTHLEELAESIRNVGLINPPVVDDELNLVAGERRLTACRDILGWTSIPVQFASDCDPTELHLIELEENVKRVDLPWQDNCHAVEEYHLMRASLDDKWSATKTAKALGISDAEVSSRRQVSKALREGDPLVTAADRYSTARGIVSRKASRAADSEKGALDNMLTASSKPASQVPVTTLFSEDISAPELEEVSIPFLNAEFADFARTYSGPRFNFLHCDFPYGIEAGSHNMGAGSSFGTYEDSPDVYWNLLQTLADSMQNLVADSAHMMFWFSMDYYSDTKLILERMGWIVNPFPLIWHKSDNSGIMPDPTRGPRRIYETAFLCSRGDRLVVQPVANTFAAPNKKLIHMSEKNPDMLRHFFRMFVDEHTIMLDPTMGSGNAVRVAQSMGAHTFLGLERDAEFFSAAKDAYIAALTPGD